MLLPTELNLGSIDAVNYKQRKEKNFLERIFFRDEDLDSILEPRRYFLIGEKGTGKTAYAVLLNNIEYQNTRATIKNITETDYRKFLSLKNQEHLKISNYNDIWRTIILLIVSDHLVTREPSNILSFDKFKKLKAAIDEYYANAFSPEIVYALEFVENYELAANLLSKHANIGGKTKSQSKKQVQSFQTNLMYIQKIFEQGISTLKLERNHIIFIDGIDIRPDGIAFIDYMECIKGLAQAAWSLNSEYFANIRDSKGRIKIVVLIRPDIFDSLGYQNSNAKVRDNAVYLDWRTTYSDYRGSRIFRLIDGILGKQQTKKGEYVEIGSAWDFYFPYDVPHLTVAERLDNPFIGFLRYSLYRPRDIISYLLIMQDYAKLHESGEMHFTPVNFKNCQSDYSDYLLGEVRNELDFYYSNAEFKDLTLFFSYLKGRNHFTFIEFTSIYPQYQKVVLRRKNPIPEIVDGPEEFLQFLYSLNVIGYQETTEFGKRFVHWCFRDRTRINLNPGVHFGLEYNIHPGLARALLVGRG